MNRPEFDRMVTRIDAELAAAGLTPCLGPGCPRAVLPWVSPCCSTECHAAARSAGLTDHGRIQGLPAHAAVADSPEPGDGLARDRAVPAGAPMSVLHDPDWHPADEPQPLAPCPPRPPEPPLTQPDSITCPRCGRASHHPDDVRERYCGACHAYHDQLRIGLPLVDPRGMVQARPPWWRRLLTRLGRRAP